MIKLDERTVKADESILISAFDDVLKCLSDLHSEANKRAEKYLRSDDVKKYAGYIRYATAYDVAYDKIKNEIMPKYID